MRREFIEFEKRNPNYHSLENTYINKLIFKFKFAIYKFKLSNILPGSEDWHKLQQQISMLSSTNNDMMIRNYFFEHSVKECKGKPYILPNTILCYPHNISLGYNVFINRNVYITARTDISIGDNVLIGPGVIINSGMHNFYNANTLIRDQGHKLEPIIIKDDVWIGANSVIMPGVTLNTGCIIGAGAIVTKSIPAYSIAVGVPAKVIKYRINN